MSMVVERSFSFCAECTVSGFFSFEWKESKPKSSIHLERDDTDSADGDDGHPSTASIDCLATPSLPSALARSTLFTTHYLCDHVGLGEFVAAGSQ